VALDLPLTLGAGVIVLVAFKSIRHGSLAADRAPAICWDLSHTRTRGGTLTLTVASTAPYRVPESFGPVLLSQ
jgi:hypothetical protein